MFKWRLCNKAELHGPDSGAESKQLGAGCSQTRFSFLVPAIVSPSGKRTRTTDSLLVKALCLVDSTLPLQFSGASVRNHRSTSSANANAASQTGTAPHPPKPEPLGVNHRGWRCFRRESGSRERFSISGQLGRTRCNVLLRMDWSCTFVPEPVMWHF